MRTDNGVICDYCENEGTDSSPLFRREPYFWWHIDDSTAMHFHRECMHALERRFREVMGLCEASDQREHS